MLFFCRYGDDPDPYVGADIYQASITPVLDFNADGIINSLDFNILNSHLGEQGDHVAYVDISPPPFGDGRIDERDLNVFKEESSREEGLMAHWKLDEGGGEMEEIAYDCISGFDGVVYGTDVLEPVPSWQQDIGKVDGALLLDGVDDYVSTPFVWNPASGPFSAFTWVFGGNPGQAIISQTDSTGSVGRNGVDDGKIWLGIDSLERKVMTVSL